MEFKTLLSSGLVYLDGGTGTLLQAAGLQPGELPETWNILHPEIITDLHRSYYEAGSNVVCTNTFGANCLKYDGKDGRFALADVVRAAVRNARKAADEAPGRFVALDIGPLGKMLQPLGDLPFERAVEIFAETVRAGKEGADLVLIETMNDSYETKAALLAVKETCDLPVLVSTVYDESGKLMTGATPEAMVAMLEGMGADAIGMNCSLGPRQMAPLVSRLVNAASVPVLVKPNAGLPRSENGKTVFDVTAEEFADIMADIVRSGARLVGGCCGTTPEHIRKLVAATREIEPQPVTPKHRTVVSSYTHAVEFGSKPVMIGERLNPTGKKRLKEALRAGDLDYILSEGLRQQDQNAAVLDVNVGLPELDEPAVLTRCVTALQAVCDLPLQLDTSDPAAMEQALRLYNGKAMVNSVSGKEESMRAIFPLVKKYGGLVVCLTLDEQGIPATAEGRLAIAKKIVARAAEYGIGVHDLIFDPLAMTVATDDNAGRETLRAVQLIHEELGAKTSLGISNVSFGLPQRETLTAAFLTMALQMGLDAAICNPGSAALQNVWHSYLALSGKDPGCAGYIAYMADQAPAAAAQAPAAAPADAGARLQEAILRGLSGEAGKAAAEALQGTEPLSLVQQHIVPALDTVGRAFEEKRLFLPQLLMSAEAAKAAFEQVKAALPAGSGNGPALVLATVKGDIHDIGKNIVKVLLENYGYRVIDLGKDVPPQAVADAVKEHHIKLVGLSALMTTTVPAMADTIALLRETAPDCKVVVGGAVLTQEYADQIGADRYAPGAMDTVRYAEEILGKA